MILKKVFNPFAVARYMRLELALSLVFSAAVYWLNAVAQVEKAVLPFAVAAMLGSGLAIFLAFRNNNAYNRWWEARTHWANILNNSRIFTRQLVANVDNAVQTGKCTAEQADAYRSELVFRQIAFAHALRLHLRGQDDPGAYRHLLSDPEFRQAAQMQNVPNFLLLQQGRRIREGIRTELLGGFDNISMEPTLAGFNNFQGACERIKQTPLLRQYHYFTRLFMIVFILVLPFSLAGDFMKLQAPALMVPVSVIIAFVFGVMGKVGEVNEDPFENQIQDVPMTAICNTIERDLKEMIGASGMPPKAEPKDGFLF